MATRSEGGIGVLGILGIIFICLKVAKVTEVATWSWWLVLMPFWIGFAIWLVLVAVIVIAAIFRK